MPVVALLPPEARFSAKVRQTLDKLASMEELETFGTVAAFRQRLHEPLPREAITILVVSDERDLDELNLARDVLDDLRLIVVLPNGGAGALAQAHALWPRVVLYCEYQINQLEDIVSKMSDTPAHSRGKECAKNKGERQ